MSKDSSAARSLGNGIHETIDGKKTAIKLTADDFRIDSLQFSVWMADPEFDEETQTFTAKTGASHVTYGKDKYRFSCIRVCKVYGRPEHRDAGQSGSDRV